MNADDWGEGSASGRGVGGVVPARDQEHACVRTCPNCGRALAERSCKLTCPNPECGYFLSCSDYL